MAENGVDFSTVPEECVSEVIALTSPRDACRLSTVSKSFKVAADSDLVWARFLPSDTKDLLDRAAALRQIDSKKQLYFSLCNSPIHLDEGRMSFSLNRSSGRKCYMLSPRALAISWGDDLMYWRWIATPGSRFHEVAELITVCWFDIRGRIDARLLSPSTSYSAYLVFRSTSDSYGFSDRPIEVRVGLVDRESAERTVFLSSEGRGPAQNQQNVGRVDELALHNHGLELPDVDREGMDRYPEQRGDGWLEVRLGEFFCEGGYDSGVEMEMSVREVRHLLWKGGLIIQGIEIRPAEV